MGVGVDSLMNYLKGSWGLSNHGIRNANVDLQPGTEELRFIPTDPKYKEMLEYMNKLYKEKLIGEDVLLSRPINTMLRVRKVFMEQP